MKKTTVHYRVAISRQGSDYTSWLAPDGYSKYPERWKMYSDKQITSDEIYGLEQAKDHIREYYAKIDEYTEKRRLEKLSVERVSTTVEVAESFTFPHIFLISGVPM